MVKSTCVNINCVNLNVDWIKVYVIKSKNGIMMNVSVSGKNSKVGVLAKRVIMNPSACEYECKKRVNLVNV